MIGLLASMVGIARRLRPREGPQRALRARSASTCPSAGTVFETRTVIVVAARRRRRDHRSPRSARRCAPRASRRWPRCARAACDAGRASAASALRRSRSARSVLGIGLRGLRHLRRRHRTPTAVLSAMGGGSLLLFIGVALFVAADRPAAGLACSAGRPRAVGGSAGRLARDNAMRNPQPHRHDRRRAHDRHRARHLRGGARRRACATRSSASLRRRRWRRTTWSPRQDGWSPFAAGSRHRLRRKRRA